MRGLPHLLSWQTIFPNHLEVEGLGPAFLPLMAPHAAPAASAPALPTSPFSASAGAKPKAGQQIVTQE